jgi:hypothetical protein
MGRVLRLGPRALAGACGRRSGYADHSGGNRHLGRADPPRSDGRAAGEAAAGQDRVSEDWVRGVIRERPAAGLSESADR